MLSLGEKDNPTIVWSNLTISNNLQETEDLKRIDVDGIYLSLRQKKLGFLRITDKGTNFADLKVVFCHLTLNPKEETERTQITIPNEDIVENVLAPIIPKGKTCSITENIQI